MGQNNSSLYMSNHKLKEITQEKLNALKNEKVSLHVRTYSLFCMDYRNTPGRSASYLRTFPFLCIKFENRDYCLFTYSYYDDCHICINGEWRGITISKEYSKTFDVSGELKYIRSESELKVFSSGSGIIPNMFRTVNTIIFVIDNYRYEYITYSKFYHKKNESNKILKSLKYKDIIGGGFSSVDTGYSEGADFENLN